MGCCTVANGIPPLLLMLLALVELLQLLLLQRCWPPKRQILPGSAARWCVPHTFFVRVTTSPTVRPAVSSYTYKSRTTDDRDTQTGAAGNMNSGWARIPCITQDIHYLFHSFIALNITTCTVGCTRCCSFLLTTAASSLSSSHLSGLSQAQLNQHAATRLFSWVFVTESTFPGEKRRGQGQWLLHNCC